ncbi:MAG: SDR family oxidoreductase [Anaerolineaceae bacterium]|nr:SDR family oxidoreductase [Anaerolineaceae bacterium]
MNKRKHVALVTGAEGGIGKEVVKVFLDRDWRVIGVDRRDRQMNEREDFLYIQADISDPAQIEEIFLKAQQFSPELDAVINNAAIQISRSILTTTAEDWDLVMASNLRSVFLGAKLAHPLMVAAGGGAIVNVSSVHAIATSKNISAYAASKGGLLALTRAMAIEFAPDNIRVNAVLPGAVDTPMLRKSMNRNQFGDSTLQSRLDNLAAKTVNGRIGTPREIANPIYFLADNDQSSFITGQALVIDGGATARLSTE